LLRCMPKVLAMTPTSVRRAQTGNNAALLSNNKPATGQMILNNQRDQRRVTA
jgi:hypothetical protein